MRIPLVSLSVASIVVIGLPPLPVAGTGQDDPSPAKTLAGHEGPVMALAFHPGGELLASGSADGTLRLWDIAKGAVRTSFDVDGETARAIAFSPDGKYLAAGGDGGAIRIWDVDSGKEIHKLEGHRVKVRCLAFAPDGKTLASGGGTGMKADPSVRLWDVGTGRVLHKLGGHQPAVRTLAFRRDGKVLAAGSGFGKAVRLWDPSTGKHVGDIKGMRVYDVVAFAADGESILTLGPFEVQARRVKGGELIWTIETDFASDYAVRPDGLRFAAGTSRTQVAIHDTNKGMLLRKFEAHTLNVNRIAYGPEGKSLATGGADRLVKIWDLSKSP